MFDPSSLPLLPGELLVLTDKLAAPAEFILLALLAKHQKQNATSTCVFASFTEDISHWKAVASKSSSGVNFVQHLASQNLVFLNCVSETRQFSADDTYLENLYNRIQESLGSGAINTVKETSPTNLVILDSFSTLEWLGTALPKMRQFIRALHVLCMKSNACLIIRHPMTSDQVEDLLRTLFQQCSYHIEVLPLASGRSGVINGEIALHLGPAAESQSLRGIPRSNATQYRLSDAGATYFDKGTTPNVL